MIAVPGRFNTRALCFFRYSWQVILCLLRVNALFFDGVNIYPDGCFAIQDEFSLKLDGKIFFQNTHVFATNW